MRETTFIQQNREKWQDFEQFLDERYKDPEKLNDLFIQITDDLSFSRTFYPNRSVRVYINGLAQRIFFRIYRARKSPLGRLGAFWTDELPQLMYETRRDLRLSFWLIAFSFLIGAVSCAMDAEFASIILGEDYVAMTLENIESGDPLAVYKQRGQFGMALGITANNLLVAFLTFALGALFMVGTIAVLIRNGIMVGVFQYFFVERDLFWESFLTIWTHGALEISAIVIAGAAGLTMGRGLVFPGAYTRLQSFQRSARRGIKIMIGIAPIIVLAGFIESYLTRHTDTPNFIRALFILVCLLFVIGYFVWYPRYRAALGFSSPLRESDIPAGHAAQIDFGRIKSSGEIFSDVFLIFKSAGGKLAGLALLTSLSFTAAAFLLGKGEPEAYFSFPDSLFGVLGVVNQFFVNERIALLPVINLSLFAVLTAGAGALLIRRRNPQRRFSAGQYLSNGFKALAGLALIQIILWTNAWFTPFLFLFLAPLPMLWNHILQEEGVSPWHGLNRAFFLLQGNYGRVLSLFLTLSLIGLLFFTILDTGILWLYLDLVSWIVQLEETAMDRLSVYLLTATTIFILHMIAAMLFTGVGLLYYTLLEIQQADGLKARIRKIELSRRIQGLEKEG